MENTNIKKFVFLLFLPLFLFSSESNFNYTQNKNDFINSFEDDDLDGVANAYDKCPNTPFWETVDQRGCSKNQKISFLSSYYISLSYGFVYTTKKRAFKNHSHHKAGLGKKRKKDSTYREIYIPFNIFATKDSWLYSLTTGYIFSKDDGKRVDSLADTVFSVGYLFDTKSDILPVFSLKAKLEYPSSKESTKNNYTLQLETYKNIKKHSFFTDIGYTRLGAYNGYKNIFYFDIDYSYEIRNFLNTGVLYSFTRNSFVYKNTHNLTLYTSYSINRNLKLYLGYTTQIFHTADYKSFALTLSTHF